MLQGDWPTAGCHYCQNVEAAGGMSDRKMNLEQLENPGLVPPELYQNPTATTVTPTILEVYFTNTCNMKCIYCGPHHSSLWQEENRKFGDLFPNHEKFSVTNTQINPNYDQMVADLWKYLADQDRYKTLQRYHILGGEPFLLKELDQSIDFWEQHGNPDLIFSVVSNLNVPHKRFTEYMHRLRKLVLSNKIRQLQLTASLDCWGPEAEFVRYGLDLGLWQKNFESILNEPWVAPSINSAVSALTIKTMPALIEKINVWNTGQTRIAGRWRAEPILFSFNTTNNDRDESYFFGPGVFDQDFEKILALMPQDTKMQQEQWQAMHGIYQTQRSSTRNPQKLAVFKQYLDTLDARRGTDWRTVLPWLGEQLD